MPNKKGGSSAFKGISREKRLLLENNAHIFVPQVGKYTPKFNLLSK